MIKFIVTIYISILLLVVSSCAPQVSVEQQPIGPEKTRVEVDAESVEVDAESVEVDAESVEVDAVLPQVETAELINLSLEGVKLLLGEPDLYREEVDSQVLLYSERACALHIFLYPPAPGAVPLVKHTETIPTVLENESDRACLSKLLARERN